MAPAPEPTTAAPGEARAGGPGGIPVRPTLPVRAKMTHRFLGLVLIPHRDPRRQTDNRIRDGSPFSAILPDNFRKVVVRSIIGPIVARAASMTCAAAAVAR